MAGSLTDGLLPNEIVVFTPNVKKRLRLANPRRESKYITDSETSQTKLVQALAFDVLQEDGAAVQKTLSVIQKRLIAQLDPYLANGTLDTHDVEILKQGEGFQGAHWTLELIPRQT